MSLADMSEEADLDRAPRSTRNPRRRQRPDSDSIKIAPRRKRSKITETTFLPREEAAEAAEDDREMNGHAARVPSRSHGVRKTSAHSLNGGLDMPVRARNNAKRVPRTETTITLTQSENYSIKLLASTPPELKSGKAFRAELDPQSSLALATTREKVYIWEHTGYSSVSSTRIVELPLDFVNDDVLPFGALVTGSSANDLGLVLVSARAGRVIYHESISSVASVGFFSEPKDGITGIIQGMSSGETVVQFTSAHPTGFVALLSSGRVAHLALRDSQGKPKIQSQILQSTDQATGGFFGSLKSMITSTMTKHAMCSVRIRTLERGQVQVVGMLERGELRTWDVDWTGQYTHQRSLDFREELHTELRQMLPTESRSHLDYLTVLDFAISDRSTRGRQELVLRSAATPLDTTALIRCGPSSSETFYVVQLSFNSDEITIRRILTLAPNSTRDPADYRPRLLIPDPGTAAFIIRSHAVTCLSLAITASDPEAQLHEASYIQPEPYQDTVYLRDSPDSLLLGGESEAVRPNGDSSCILFVRGTGALRLSAKADVRDLEPVEVVKSKLEQAVFFGTLENNILDLDRRADPTYTVGDIEAAALALSKEIFSCTSSLLDMPPVSIESSLMKRERALQTLAETLHKSYPILSRVVSWQLLTQAEKIAAAVQLWRDYEQNSKDVAKGKRTASLWHEIVQCIQGKAGFSSMFDESNPDELVKTFFLTQLNRLSEALDWACQIVSLITNKETDTTPDIAIKVTSEADDIWLGCLDTVFGFRVKASQLYGIQPGHLDDGIVPEPANIRGVEEPWTSTAVLLKQVVKMTEEARRSAADAYEADPDATTEKYAMKIAEENAQLIELSCLMYRERISWCWSHGSEKYNDQAAKLQLHYEAARYNQIRALAGVGQVKAGLQLAEKYRDMDTLTVLLVAESQYLFENRIGAPQAERQAIDAELEKNQRLVTRYFEMYGEQWSEAFYGHAFTSGTVGAMLAQNVSKWQAPLTAYLRKDPSRAKVCWINDVLQNKDFNHAGDALLYVANEQEDNLWSKKVQLSLAKLTMSAAQEDRKAVTNGSHVAATGGAENGLIVLDVQERLYDHISPATYRSLDSEVALSSALASFAKGIRFAPLHETFLTPLMSKLLEHKSLSALELIDLLTLTDSAVATPEEQELFRSETFEALTVLYTTNDQTSTQFDLYLKLIWNRAYLQQDFAGLNDVAATDGDSDAQEAVRKTNLYRAMYNVLEQDSTETYRILEPEETLSAGCHLDDLPTYVPGDMREQYLEENLLMQREIERLLQEERMASWVQDIRRLATDDLAAYRRAQNSTLAGERDGEPSDDDDDLHIIGNGVGNGKRHTPNGIKVESEDERMD